MHGKILEFADEQIVLPAWLPIHAVDPRTGQKHRQYWEMVSIGSITLTGDQLDEALRLTNRVEELIKTLQQ